MSQKKGTFTSLAAALKQPEQVEILNLYSERTKELPPEIKTLPATLGELTAPKAQRRMAKILKRNRKAKPNDLGSLMAGFFEKTPVWDPDGEE